MVGMGVGSGRILGKVVNPFPVLYTIYFVRGVRGNGGDVARLLVAFGTDGSDRVGTGVPVV